MIDCLAALIFIAPNENSAPSHQSSGASRSLHLLSLVVNSIFQASPACFAAIPLHQALTVRIELTRDRCGDYPVQFLRVALSDERGQESRQTATLRGYGDRRRGFSPFNAARSKLRLLPDPSGHAATPVSRMAEVHSSVLSIADWMRAYVARSLPPSSVKQGMHGKTFTSCLQSVE